jgi:hypothetical protein
MLCTWISQPRSSSAASALFSCVMVATRASERAIADASNPLSDAGILKQVLSYVGAGKFIFYAPIKILWLACYRAVPAHELVGKDTVCCKQDFKALSKMTLRRAVRICCSCQSSTCCWIAV